MIAVFTAGLVPWPEHFPPKAAARLQTLILWFTGDGLKVVNDALAIVQPNGNPVCPQNRNTLGAFGALKGASCYGR